MPGTRRILSASSAARTHHAGTAFLREWAASSEVVLIAPTRAAADELARAACGDGLAGIHRLTLGQMAAIASAPKLAAAGKAPLSQLALEALAARVTHELRSRNGLPYFTPVADTPGFARALASTLGELRMQGSDAERIEESGAPGADLAALLRLFRAHLDRQHMADAAAILELAIGAPTALAGLPLLLLDVPVRTALERRFLEWIAAASPAVLATVPEGDAESLAAIEAALGVRSEAVEEPAGTALERVRRYLFRSDLAPGDGARESLEVFSAAGEGLECVEAARRLHALAAGGIPFDRCAILLRSPDRYLPLVEEALRRAGIPAYFSRGTSRPDPAGRALLALLACASEKCSAARFGEYLSLAQVPLLDEGGAPVRVHREWTRTEDAVLESFQRGTSEPAERGPDGPSLTAPLGWEQLLVEASVIGGQERWKRRLEGLAREMEVQRGAAEDERRRAALDRRIGQLHTLRRFALPLIERLSELPAEGSWMDWIGHLTGLAETALRHPESVLGMLNELRPMADVGPVALDEVYGVLRERLSFLRTEPPPRRYGCVWVGSIEEARGRGFDAVFLPGLAEGIFPKRAAEDPLLLDSHRETIGGLALQDQRVARERLLLRIAAGCARERLIVSYPRMDTAPARPRVPSFYALEVVRAADGGLPELKTFERSAKSAVTSSLGFPAPADARQAIDDAEYDIAVMRELTELPAGAAAGRAHYLIGANASLVRSLRARYRRWQKRWTAADGLVDANLDDQRISRRSYSPTALQHFAACPYRFALSAILRLQPREMKAAVEKLDPLTRGALFHEVQFAFLNSMRQAGSLPLRMSGVEGALDLADRVLNEAERRYAEELAPAIAGVWRTEIEDIRTDLRGWVRQLAESGGDWVPLYFEFAFGLRPDARRDPASREQAAVLPSGARISGSVDLIERHAARGVLRVTDHKTGRPPEPIPLHVGGGRALQPLLYSLAVEQLLETPVEMARLSHCTQRGKYTDIHMAVKEHGRHAIALAVETIDSYIGDGFLPAAPAPETCGFCDYHAVCGPYEELRAGKKSQDELKPLNLLRSLP